MRTIVLAALVATAGLTGAHAETTARELRDAMKHQERGHRSLRDGKIEKAEKNFLRSLKKVESFPGAHLGLGHVAMQRRDFEGALLSYTRARDGYGTLGELLMEFEGKRYMEAQRELIDEQEFLQKLRGRPLTNGESETQREHTIAQTEGRIHRLRAIEAPSATRVDKTPGELYFYVGNALYNLRRIPDALDAWLECADRSPDFALVHNNLAAIYMQVGRLDDAREHLAQAEQLGFPVSAQFKSDLERRLARASAASD